MFFLHCPPPQLNIKKEESIHPESRIIKYVVAHIFCVWIYEPMAFIHPQPYVVSVYSEPEAFLCLKMTAVYVDPESLKKYEINKNIHDAQGAVDG